MRPNRLWLLVLVTMITCWVSAQSHDVQSDSAESKALYLDPNAPIDQRVDDLVSRMTLEEKISQMQNNAPAIPRLGIPAYGWANEALHGVALAGHATVFPQAVGLAATWDTDLVHRIADVISTEARAKHNDAIQHGNFGEHFGLDFWSPNINIFRDPRWGRGQETYGEDPFLASRMAVAFVSGLQGDDPKYFKVISTPKHYAVHSGPEVWRHQFDATPSAHDFADTYTPAFRAAIVEGRADSVMCAYSSLDGDPACTSPKLFDLLRNKWGFKGYVVSDCGAVGDMFTEHYYVRTMPQASAFAVKAGTDLDCGREYRVLNYAVADRMLSVAEIDRAVKRLFEARFRLGMFDPPELVPWSRLTLADNDTAEHRQLALEAARESIVLLKNDGNTLPLKPSVKNIAIIGPNADSLDVLLGNYNGMPSQYSTILDGIRKRFPDANVTYSVGSVPVETFGEMEERLSKTPIKLVLTSPPYPGVHVLYHRWQVQGRRETPAPYWIADIVDGNGASHYTFGDRQQADLDSYFRRALEAFKSIARITDSGTIIVQMIAFSDPSWQLQRYLNVMEIAGFQELRFPELTNAKDGRVWRSVPNRRWYASQRGSISSSKEVVLFHERCV